MAKRKKKTPKEYRLLVTPHFNERQQKFNTLFVLQTVDSFASFRYDISVDEHLEKKTIRYTVLGLKAPELSLPASGHAQFVREYESLHGKYQLVVEGLDGIASTASVRISPKQVKVVTPPSERFVKLITDPAQWEEQ